METPFDNRRGIGIGGRLGAPAVGPADLARSSTDAVRVVLARLPYRAIAVVLSVALAYNYSLQTLMTGLGEQTPLAYLALVPPTAILLGAANIRLNPVLPAIHDRQVDWIIGLFLVAGAGMVTFLLPSAYSTDFWIHRLDMLGLPLFAAGVVAISYGVRRLWSMRWAIAFLLLAWPDPYVSVLASAIGASTDIALAFVGLSLHLIPVAQPLGDGVFLIDHGNTPFSLAVGSACSGINSLVGFLIVGAALNTIFKGGLLRRIVWMAAGLVLVGALNVLRIDLIFLAGWSLGQDFALDVLHPVAGIIVFGIGATLMWSIAPFFGLKVPVPATAAVSTQAASAPAPESSAGSARSSGRKTKPVSTELVSKEPAPAAPARRAKKAMAAAERRPTSIAAAPAVASSPKADSAPARSSRRRPFAWPAAVSLALGLVFAMPNAGFAHYDSLVDAFGSPTLGTIDPATIAISGWQASDPVEFDQATQYFGAGGTWERVPFASLNPSASGPTNVYLDVIRTDDSSSLAAYGVEACYNFHGFSQVASSTADVGAGVAAKLADYRSPIGGTDWSILWWEWPFNAGGQTRYERLVLLAPLDSTDQPSGRTTDAAFAAARTTLTSLARQIVARAMSDLAPTPDPQTLR